MRNSGNFFVMLCFSGKWSPMMAVGLYEIALFEDEASAVRAAVGRQYQVFQFTPELARR